ncbi:MAG TPA: hypothetical protein VGS27_22295 [Candidatus Sulfotelmatobacter sp.]|nr:hypothetical protein [Candidatus Sulfotelmatobacter sp.]
MISTRLVRLIEQHSDELSYDLVAKLHRAPRTHSLQKIPAADLQRRILETLHDFHSWLLRNDAHHSQERYRDLGRHHAAQDVSLPDLCWAIVLIKEHVWDFASQQVFHTTPLEIHAELELIRLLDLFFDDMIFHVAEGYEQVRGKHAAGNHSDNAGMTALPGSPKGVRPARGKEAVPGQR